MLNEIPTPCIIDPTKRCTCASEGFAKMLFLKVVKALMEENNMTETLAVNEYRKADSITRAMALPDQVNNNCPNSPFKKFAAKKIAI